MPNKSWTLEPEIEAFMQVIELPPNEFMQQLAAERAPLEAAAPKLGEQAPAFSALPYHSFSHGWDRTRLSRPPSFSPLLRT